MLANLFLHYAFDMWMARTFPGVPFERYVDDGVVHCVSQQQAEMLRDAIGQRMAEVGLKLLGQRPSNLPAELASFVGHRQELREVKHLLGTAWLLTLTGSGGAGKTRLALRAAAEMARGFPDGAWLVSLAPVQDPLLVSERSSGRSGRRTCRRDGRCRPSATTWRASGWIAVLDRPGTSG